MGKILIVGMLWLGLTIWLVLRVLDQSFCRPKLTHGAWTNDSPWTWTMQEYSDVAIVHVTMVLTDEETLITCKRDGRNIVCTRGGSNE